MKITQVNIFYKDRTGIGRFSEYVVFGGDAASVKTFVTVKQQEIAAKGGVISSARTTKKTQGESVRGELVNLG